MQKIPTLFIRDKEDPRRVTRTVDPQCKWVLDGEGRATEKFDGSACLVERGQLYRRHEHDASKGDPPPGWLHWTFNPNQRSGHGWLPCVKGDPSARYHFEAFEVWGLDNEDGTYELVGPKINRNAHRLRHHQLWRHGSSQYSAGAAPRDYDGLAEWLRDQNIEGLVWHHPDGRMAKIKRRDFGLPWPRVR